MHKVEHAHFWSASSGQSVSLLPVSNGQPPATSLSVPAYPQPPEWRGMPMVVVDAQPSAVPGWWGGQSVHSAKRSPGGVENFFSSEPGGRRELIQTGHPVHHFYPRLAIWSVAAGLARAGSVRPDLGVKSPWVTSSRPSPHVVRLWLLVPGNLLRTGKLLSLAYALTNDFCNQ